MSVFFVFVCRYLVAVLSMSGHRIGKNKERILLAKFINHIDNTLNYRSQVELSIQMSYSNCISTRMLLPLEHVMQPLQCCHHCSHCWSWVCSAQLCNRKILGLLERKCNVNVSVMRYVDLNLQGLSHTKNSTPLPGSTEVITFSCAEAITVDPLCINCKQ